MNSLGNQGAFETMQCKVCIRTNEGQQEDAGGENNNMQM